MRIYIHVHVLVHVVCNNIVQYAVFSPWGEGVGELVQIVRQQGKKEKNIAQYEGKTLYFSNYMYIHTCTTQQSNHYATGTQLIDMTEGAV